jgi:hypothetical protein
VRQRQITTRIMKLVIAVILIFPSLSPAQSLADNLREEVLDGVHVQSKNELSRFCSYNFAVVWRFGITHEYDGFASDSMTRVRLRFCSLRRRSPTVYAAKGFFRYKGQMTSFQGELKLTDVALINPYDEGCEDPYPIEKILVEGIVLADFRFSLSDSGYLAGTCSGAWWVDSTNHLHANYRGDCSDGFVNNQFAGTYYSSSMRQSMETAWGDFCIPFSRDLDIGVGEFSPNPKYADQGWQSYLDAYDAPQSRSSHIYQTYPEKDSVYWPCQRVNNRTSPNIHKKDPSR